MYRLIFRGVVQSVEHQSPKLGVQSSSLCAPAKKIQVERLGFFHLCPQDTTLFACLHATSFSRRLTSFRRKRTQMNDVALRANDVLRNDVGYSNDVALRANGIKPFTWCAEI